MVKYGLVSVGVLVESERSPDEDSPLFLGVKYRENMADFIITVSDHDSSEGNEEEEERIVHSTKNHPSQSPNQSSPENSELIEKHGTLERIFGSESNIYSFDSDRINSKSTIRNRPSCRKNRGESKIQLQDNGNVRAYNNTGLKNSSSAYKSCDYYRQKFHDEACLGALQPGTSEWLNYSTIQKTAGQKVVNKLAAQQKALEAEAEQQRKKLLLGSNSSCSSSDSENRNLSPQQSYRNLMPLKKRTVRLEPIPFHSIKISE